MRLILLALTMSFPALAMQRVQGFCEQGGKVVVTSGLNSTTKVQGSYPLCTVTVYPNGSSTPVAGNSIFSDNGSTVLGNPFTADANGHWFFYAANGRYDVKLSGTITTWTIGDVLLSDPAGPGTVSSVTGGTGISVSGTNSVVVTNTMPMVTSSNYDFAAQAPGGSLIGGGGIQTVNMAPCPVGLNGSDVGHYAYVSGGTGTAEAVLIAGGTCTSGATSGSIFVAPANSHSGAWTITSASSGIAEALYANASVYVPPGTHTVRAPIHVATGNSIKGAGVGVTVVDLVHATADGFVWTTNVNNVGISEFSITSSVTRTGGWAIGI